MPAEGVFIKPFYVPAAHTERDQPDTTTPSMGSPLLSFILLGLSRRLTLPVITHPYPLGKAARNKAHDNRPATRW